MQRRLKAMFLAGGAVAALTAAPALAQTATEPQRQGLDEIIVTAQRRSESLQDVPVSVTAFSQEDLAKQQLNTVQDLLRVVPSAQRTINRGDPTSLLLGLRGVPTAVLTMLQDSSVGVYINGVYIARTQGQGLGVVDMHGVEVLSGPQGTLFGRNTIGGLINLNTARPKDEFGGYLSATYGNFETINAEAVVNLPLQDDLGLRVVYSHQQHDGYLKNSFAGGVDQKALNAEYVRGTLAFTPDDWDIAVIGDYAENNSINTATNVRYVLPNSASATAFLWQRPTADIFDVYTAQRDRLIVKNWGVSGIISKAFGDLTVKSVTGYRNLRTSANLAPFPGVSPGLPNSAAPGGNPIPLVRILNNGADFYNSISQELQVYGKAFDGKLNYIAGAYYFRERGRDSFAVEALPNISLNVGGVVRPVQSLTMNTYIAENESLGLFGQLTYEVVPGLRVTGGIRYTRDTRAADQTTYNYATPGEFRAGALNCLVPADFSPTVSATYPYCVGSPPTIKDDFVPWTVGVDYRASDDVLLYAKVSRGFRSGGQGTGGTPDPSFFSGFSPEQLTSYEGGFKGEFLDRHLRVNVAAYYSDYKNVQQSILQVPAGGRSGLLKIVNGGDARIWGGEFNLTLLAGDRLRFNAVAGYTNAKYTSGPFKDGGPAFAGGPNFIPNTPYLQTPEWTLAVSADYPVDLGDSATLNLHADYNLRSDVYFSRLFANMPEFNRNLVQDGFGLLNAMITLDLKNTPLSASVFAKNIGNVRYTDTIQEGLSLGGIYQFPGDPRTYGLTLKYRFD
jgi:iron complex outermembrane receptor protein